MRKFFVYFLILFSIKLTAQTGADYCSQSKINYYNQTKTLSKAAYPGDSNIDVTYYKLNLSVDYANKYLSGIVTVKGKAAGNTVSSFFLDLWSGFKVNSVKSNGQNLQFNLSSSNTLNITLDKSYSGTNEFSVDISYEGVPITAGGIGGSIVFDTTQAGDPVVWTLSQPYGARDWWPSKDTPGDKADSSDVWITADQFFTSVSNGTLVATDNNNNGTKTYKWHNSYPISNYLISMALSNYAVYQSQFQYETNKTMPVTNFIYPDNVTSYKPVLDLVPQMLHIFSDKFGLYPFIKEKYGHAECGFGGGMEHQTCTSLGAFRENVISHELAHQWFGDKITCKDWNNIWLNEGFASYCECIYREVMYGENDFKNYTQNFMNIALGAQGSIYVQDSHLNNIGYIFDPARTYKKGAIVLHMLRGIIGDDKFFETMKEYASEPGLSYNVATTEDFQRVAERVSGQDLNYFFSEWIYGENYPQYTFDWNYKHRDGDNYSLILHIKQESNSNPQFFTMPIQVKYTTSNETKTITIYNNLQEQEWEIPVNGLPAEVVFDPDNWILKKVNELTPVDDNNELVSTFALEQNYPNPFNPETTIKFSIPSSSFVTLKVYDQLGREITTLINHFIISGLHSFQFDAQKLNLSSGVYYYKLQADNLSGFKYSQTKKMIYLK